MPFGRWGTVDEARKHFGLSRQRIHELREKGVLGECVLMNVPGGQVWMIPYPFKREKLPIGRPRKEEGQCKLKG